MNATSPNRRLGYRDAIDYLYDRINYESLVGRDDRYRFRLKRTEELFSRLGLDEYLYRPGSASRPKVPVVHLAGTKGKGSTGTMVSAMLTAAGYRVGLYTSPHLTDLEERFRVNGQPCSRETLVDLVQQIAPVVDQFDAAGEPVSFFELTTAMAVMHFDRCGCEAIVLEVGLGGRLDSTNVCASTVTAITSIGMDHQRVLGNTIAEITLEKAGIIKPGVPVVAGAKPDAARQVIRRVAAEVGAPLLETGCDFDVSDRRDVNGGSEFVLGWTDHQLQPDTPAKPLSLFLPLDGAHQVDNASLAITIVKLLADQLPVSDAEIAQGLRQIHCIGRLERFSLPAADKDHTALQIIIDTAHNQDSIVALCSAVRTRLETPGSPPAVASDDSPVNLRHPLVFLFGTSRDKDATVMAAEISTLADEIVCTQYTTNPRGTDTAVLRESFASLGDRPFGLHQQPDPHLALQQAMQLATPGGTVVICGSFFLAGQLRPDVLAIANVCAATTTAPATTNQCSDSQPAKQPGAESTERSAPQTEA
ncbi:bifunctional folylpolyglutamate synthase/dihydrofolate synthase [Stieleria sp. TO1_6]|uniref:bifunctional folylpolyglutamate synthase/dihydrofolate synthase n=1 Tax=Stieleria tagensis TaxID=2956795 RepID=UPI00209B06DD|nr:folylpolyglutamate synthase/dihydrofolate synthase family protein [Stieleria tagensis]MCO8124403.1 bifunctional folylpolyglutamate synthase/dihydrofolate synthase [Stieleria tagensis]